MNRPADQSRLTSRIATIRITLTVIVALLLVGCGTKKKVEPDPNSLARAQPKQSALQAMQVYANAGDFQNALKLKDSVLVQHPDDPSVIGQVAKIAFAAGDQTLAAELLTSAARADEFENARLVKQAVIGMVSVGNFFDGVQFLEEVVRRRPEQHSSRRLLFDFLHAMELRNKAREHGRALVRQRKFDFPLLLELSNTEERKLEKDSNEQLLERRPNDRRPLIAEARNHFDREKYADSEKLIREILASNQGFQPAKLLLGRILADSGRFDELAEWSKTLDTTNRQTWEYWMVIGDWARHQEKSQEAIVAYWRSIQRNPDVMQVWAKFSNVLHQQSDSPELNEFIGETTLESIQRRARLLSNLYDQKERFHRSNRKSMPVAQEIIQSLRDLGRLWEAEAWAATAMTRSVAEEGTATDSDSIKLLRQSLIRLMHQEMSWQKRTDHVELTMDLSGLPAPNIEALNQPHATKLTIAQPSEIPDLRNEATQRGVTFFGRTRDDLNRPGIRIYAELGCGGGAIDFDLDGWTDLYLSNAGGTPPNRDSDSNALFRNNSGKFENVTNAANADDLGFGQGVAIGDVNEDGFPDVLILNYGPNRLLVNNGDGTFSERSRELLPDDGSGWSSSGAIADLNADGLSDMVIVNYCKGTSPVTTDCANDLTGVTKSCAPLHFAAESDDFLMGTANGVFRNANHHWEISPSILGRGLGVTIGALDTTPGLDVLVANDMTNNHYYTPLGAGSFKLAESAMVRGLACDDRSSPQASMGIACADLDRDGDIDFYVTNFENEYNTFYEQRAAGAWQDRTAAQKLAEPVIPMVGFGSEAVDFDNDGHLELVVANGHVHFPIDDDDAQYAQPMQIFRRSQNATFEPIVPRSENRYLAGHHVGRALWTLDANRDGRMDLAVTHQTEAFALLMNHAANENHWIGLQFRGRECARDAIGAVVTIRLGELSWTSTVTAGDGYLCSNERILRFGIGDADAISELEITWPDGSSVSHSEMEGNCDWIIVQGHEPFRLKSVP